MQLRPQISFGVLFCLSLVVVARGDPLQLSEGSDLSEPPTELQSPAQLNEQQHRIDGSSFIKSRRAIGVFASTKEGDHEDAGFLTQGGGPYGGVVATHVLYTGDEFPLTLPAGAVDTQTLYAPTTRPPNGSCLEIGTAYATTPGQKTDVTVYVFDFCAGGRFGRQVAVDDNFLLNYTSSTADGLRTYTLAITTNATVVGQSANWNASLYNVRAKRWDIVYSATGIDPDIRGWTIFETWYQQGQCSKSLPIIVASNIQYKNLSSSAWEEVMPTMNHAVVEQHNGVVSNTTNTDCFHADATGPASYEFKVLKADSAWKVSSTGH